jgi:hypothetical protein
MSRRRILHGLLLLGTLAGVLGSEGDCGSPITLESLDEQVQALRADVCREYEGLGMTPPLASFDPPCPE